MGTFQKPNGIMSKEHHVGDSQEELLRHQRTPSDGDEERIVRFIREQTLKTPWAQEVVKQVREELKAYYLDAMKVVSSNSSLVHDKTQGVIKRIAEITNSKIAYGSEHLQKLANRKPCFLVGNHFGFYKLTQLHPREELGVDIELDSMNALPTFFAAYSPVATAVGNNLYLAAFPFPGIFGNVQDHTGWVTIPLRNDEGVEFLAQQTSEKIREHPNYALTVLAEGKTSGKRNHGGPYTLEDFRTGSFVIAGMLQLPIIPVAQFFNSTEGEGFEIGVFPPITPKNPESVGDQRTYFKNLAQDTQGQMQEWLNERVAAVYS